MYVLIDCTTLVILYLLVEQIFAYRNYDYECRHQLLTFDPSYSPLYVELQGKGLNNLPPQSQLSKYIVILNASDNSIANITDELSHLSELKVLNLENNSLGSLDFLPLSCNLYRLNVSNNLISNLERLKTCLNLQLVDLSGNKFQDLPRDAFGQLKDLMHVYLQNLNLQTLHVDTFSHLTKLRVLSLHGNKLQLPADVFSNSKCIRSLWLSKNEISELPFGLFAGFTQLKELYLDYNELHTIYPGTFADSRRLMYLNVAHNQLTEIKEGSLAGLMTLVDLILDHNNISDLSSNVFQGLFSLDHLSVIGNKLTQIMKMDFKALPSLTKANFQNNLIAGVTEEVLGSWLNGNYRGKGASLGGNYREKVSVLNIEGNPLHPSIVFLRLLDDPGVTASQQQQGQCNCGKLNGQNSCVRFCLEMPCENSSPTLHMNWTEALRNRLDVQRKKTAAA